MESKLVIEAVVTQCNVICNLSCCIIARLVLRNIALSVASPSNIWLRILLIKDYCSAIEGYLVYNVALEIIGHICILGIGLELA